MTDAEWAWCRDCEAEAGPACLDQHALCGQGLMRQEVAAELDAVWAGRAAALRRLAEDLRAEERLLQREEESGGRRPELAALRDLLATARAHPLHGLLDGREGVAEQAGLLRRAAVALREEAHFRLREEDFRRREEDFRRREEHFRVQEAALQERRAEREASLEETEVAEGLREPAAQKDKEQEKVAEEKREAAATLKVVDDAAALRRETEVGQKQVRKETTVQKRVSFGKVDEVSAEVRQREDAVGREVAPAANAIAAVVVKKEPVVVLEKLSLGAQQRSLVLPGTQESPVAIKMEPADTVPEASSSGRQDYTTASNEPSVKEARSSTATRVTIPPGASSSATQAVSETAMRPVGGRKRPASDPPAHSRPATPEHMKKLCTLSRPPTPELMDPFELFRPPTPEFFDPFEIYRPLTPEFIDPFELDIPPTPEFIEPFQLYRPTPELKPLHPSRPPTPDQRQATSYLQHRPCGHGPSPAVSIRPRSKLAPLPSASMAPCDAPVVCAQPASATCGLSSSTADTATFDSSIQPGTPGLAALPEELLERVLSLLPLDWSQPGGPEHLSAGVPRLLSLRLVCRRWARALLSPAVWRHRQLVFSQCPGLLRLVPAVDKLSTCLAPDNANFFKALLTPKQKVRSLEITVTATVASTKLFRRVMDAHRSSLEELLLTVEAPHARNDPNRVLAVVDSPRSLRSLKLGRSYHLPGGWSREAPLQFAFVQLKTLTKLALGANLHADTVRSLLASNAHCLREVDLGQNGNFAELLVSSGATKVRIVSVQRESVTTSLASLRHLESLDVLRAYPESEQQNQVLRELLESDALVPKEVHLKLVNLSRLQDWDKAPSMRRVSKLCVGSFYDFMEDKRRHSLFPWCQPPPPPPLALHEVESLEVDTTHDKEMWSDFMASWCDSTAPRLRRLHVKAKGVPCNGWVAQIRAQRPRLLVTVDVDD